MWRSSSALAVMVGALICAAPAGAQQTAGDVIPGSYVVVVEKGHDPKGVANERKAKVKHVYRAALNGFAAKLTDEQVADLRASRRVAAVCRASCKRASRTPAALSSVFQSCQSLRRSMGRPVGWQKTKPRSSHTFPAASRCSVCRTRWTRRASRSASGSLIVRRPALLLGSTSTRPSPACR